MAAEACGSSSLIAAALVEIMSPIRGHPPFFGERFHRTVTGVGVGMTQPVKDTFTGFSKEIP